MARILVADDDDVVRDHATKILTEAGHAVVVVADGAAARAQLSRESFDLVLADLQMPGLTGIELLREIMLDSPQVEVILLTGFAKIETAVEAMRLGAFDFIEKPVRGAELKLVVGRALEHRSLVAFRNRARRTEPALPPLSHGAPAMGPVLDALRRVSPTNATVLLLGESGTGKEVAARSVHRWSKRADGPFVAVNCAALAEGLLESELFGHEKGSFTGAESARQGRLELADGGTFFLDEIGELKPELQTKLLRLIEERAFERVGGTRTLELDVRWIAATNADLARLVQDGAFREDLYHRLAVFPVRIPPLRERREDIVPLAHHLLAAVASELGHASISMDDEAADALRRADWSGNVRQLRNALERAAILSGGARLGVADFALELPSQGPARPTHRLDAVERDTIAAVLAEESGNRRRTAERLGIALRTLYNKLQRYGLG